MKKIFGGLVSPVVLGLGMFLANFVYASEAPSPVPSPPSSPVPSPALSEGVVVAPSVTPAPKLTPAEIKQLSREFAKAQAAELEALRHRQKMEIKELIASQRAYRNEWNRKETAAAKEYYRSHKGSVFRSYVLELKARRKALEKVQEDEKVRRQNEQDSRLKALKEDQEAKLREFKEALKRGERPSPQFWPRNLY